MSISGLPAGNYLVASNVSVLFDGRTFCIGDLAADCYFDSTLTNWAAFPATQQEFGHGDRATIPLMATGTLTAASNTLRIVCTTYDRGAVIAADLFATPVDTLN